MPVPTVSCYANQATEAGNKLADATAPAGSDSYSCSRRYLFAIIAVRKSAFDEGQPWKSEADDSRTRFEKRTGFSIHGGSGIRP